MHRARVFHPQRYLLPELCRLAHRLCDRCRACLTGGIPRPARGKVSEHMGAAPASPGAPQTDDEAHDMPSCRVCWEQSDLGGEKGGLLVSPCQCSGTQKHVHLKCLRRWQESCQKKDAADERAFRCSVCRSLFSVPPPKGRPAAGSSLALQALRGLGGAICISLLAFGLSGPPWPHLALLVLLLLGSRSHWLPGLALLFVATLLAGLHARGLRVVLRVDGGGRLGVALIRHGAPVPGMGPGVLLVAADGLEQSIFRRSVVLVTQHGRGGARGVMLTQPMSHPPTLPLGLEEATAAVAEAAGGGAEAAGGGSGAAQKDGRAAGGGGRPGVMLRHFLGGPVGMPGQGVNHEVLVLHSVPDVADSRPILPPPPSQTPATAAAGSTAFAAAGSAGRGGRAGGIGGRHNGTAAAPAGAAAGSAADGGGGQQWFEGGSVSEVLERAADAAAAAVAAAAQAHSRAHRKEQPGGAAGEEAGAAPPVLLFHGICAWAEGQLEGELRAGSWAFTPHGQGPAADLLALLALPPDRLWSELAGNPALTRLR